MSKLKKKRTKKHNKVKALESSADAIMKRRGLIYFSENGSAHQPVKLIDYSGKLQNISQSVKSLLMNTKFKWVSYIAVFAIESNGKRKTIIKELAVDRRCFQHEVAVEFNDVHREMLLEARDIYKEIIGVGWFTVPVDNQISIDKVESIFESFNVFDNPPIHVQVLDDDQKVLPREKQVP